MSASYCSTAAVRDIVVDQLMWDRKYDPYGSCMAALFPLCEALYVEGFDVPPEAAFVPSPLLSRAHVEEGDDWDDVRQLLAILDADSSADEPMTYWVRVLCKYYALVKAASRDY